MPCNSVDWLSWSTPLLTKTSVAEMCISFHIVTLRGCHQQYNISQVYPTRTIFVLSRYVVSICNGRWTPHPKLMRLSPEGIMLLHCLILQRRLDWAAAWQVRKYRSKIRAKPRMEQWKLAWWGERCQWDLKAWRLIFNIPEFFWCLSAFVQSVTITSLIVLVTDR